MNDVTVAIEEVNDPEELARHQAHRERARRNWDWLQAHWTELIPTAYGKFLAVAGQEVFLGNSLEEALSWARTTHPEDTGRIVEYVAPPRGPRCYVDRG